MIDGLEREIVGVFPAELQFGRNPDVFLPLSEIVKEPGMQSRDNHQGFWALGRLKPGVTMEQANSDLNAIAVDLEKKYPDTNTGRRVTMRPLFDTTVGRLSRKLESACSRRSHAFLLIACANVANLQFARALARIERNGGPRRAWEQAVGRSRASFSSKAPSSQSSARSPAFLLTIWSLDAILALTPATVAAISRSHGSTSACSRSRLSPRCSPEFWSAFGRPGEFRTRLRFRLRFTKLAAAVRVTAPVDSGCGPDW